MIIEGVKIGGIYRHYKGGIYKVERIAFNEEDGQPIVIYHKCTIDGLYESIREYTENNGEKIVPQPFCRPVAKFLQQLDDGIRFKLIK